MRKSLQAGFTLVELLIVMAIIAILAVGVLIGLDPVEQIRKSRDTTSSSLTGDTFKALIRFQAAFAKYPWTAADTTNPGDVMYRFDYSSGTNNSGLNLATAPLFSSGELKSGTFNQLSAAPDSNTTALFVGGVEVGGENKVAACYVPISKSARFGLIAGTPEYQGFTYYRGGGASAFDGTTGHEIDLPTGTQCQTDAEFDATVANPCMLCVVEN